MAKRDMRGFEEVVRGIVSAEEDVDKVLKAAKLQRCERESFWDHVDFVEVIFGIVIVLFVFGMVAFMLLTAIFD